MKIVLLFFLLLLVGCAQKDNKAEPQRKLLKELVIDHSKNDSAYLWYGIEKEVYRIYNCEYEEVKWHEDRSSDLMHGIEYKFNSYGDTVHIIYTDYTNYPRREE